MPSTRKTFHEIPLNIDALKGEIPLAELEKLVVYEVTGSLRCRSEISEKVAFVLSIDYAGQLHIIENCGISMLLDSGIIGYTNGNMTGSPNSLFVILKKGIPKQIWCKKIKKIPQPDILTLLPDVLLLQPH